MGKCHEIMTEHPVCCLAGDSVKGIAQLMRSEDIGIVMVVDDYQPRRLIGVVTDRDLALRVLGAGRDPDTTIGDVMTLNPLTCGPESGLEVAIKLMAEHQIRRIPILNNGGGLVGIVTVADIATRCRDDAETGRIVREISRPDPFPSLK